MMIGLSTAAFYGWKETEDQAEKAAQFPVDGCEVFLQTFSEYTGEFGARVAQGLGNVPCISVHPKGTQFELDLFGQSRRQAEDALRMFTGVCDAGKAMGAKYYVFHGPPAIGGPRPPEKIRNLQQVFAWLREAAAARGIEILWENVSWCSLRTPENVRTLRELLPGIRFVLDVKQACRSNADAISMIRAMGESLAHVHVLDQRADGTLCLPGEGEADWRGIAEELRRIGYRGAVMLEPYEAQARDAAAVERCLRFLRETFA